MLIWWSKRCWKTSVNAGDNNWVECENGSDLEDEDYMEVCSED